MRFSGDYKTKFNDAVTELVAAKIADRQERMVAVDSLINEYVRDTGEVPVGAQLERLTNAILMEELTDPNNHKVAHNEYPILSDIQMSRRQMGRRGSEATNMNGEVGAQAASSVSTSGQDYRYPSRRTRTKEENMTVDMKAKIRNKERAEQYKKDSSPGMVYRYVTDPSTLGKYLDEKYGVKMRIYQ